METHPIAEATEDSIFGHLKPEEFYRHHGVKHAEEYMTNSRGMKIFTQSWEKLPSPDENAIKASSEATVVVVHGHSDDSSWMVQLTAVAMAKKGFSVHAFDMESHGRSEGQPRSSVKDIRKVADDCLQFIHVVRKKTTVKPSDGTLTRRRPLFIYGESLGAAVALLAYDKLTSAFDGMVLVGAMCGVCPTFNFSGLPIPRGPTTSGAYLAAKFMPYWPLSPDNLHVSYREPWKRRLAMANPLRAASRADSVTSYSMLRVTGFICEHVAPKLGLPFLAVHGECDRICDLNSVQHVVKSAPSLDKSLLVVPNMRHLFTGEPQPITDLVLSHILCWLTERVHRNGHPS